MGLDVAFGVGNYKDFWVSPTPFAHQLSPTTNAANVEAAIAAWNAPSALQNDAAEAQLSILNQIAENPNGQIAWRAGAKRVLVWFGDNPGHEPICQALKGLPYDIDTSLVMGKLAS